MKQNNNKEKERPNTQTLLMHQIIALSQVNKFTTMMPNVCRQNIISLCIFTVRVEYAFQINHIRN